ncbi:CAP domain-containing protein [Massilia sp. LXY-6]|uniref:CAP domain-containing protein n=1 Tax=Massilia sp. LXY-6 TaxID=3379823 RepID=UPI003EE2DD24
MPALPRLFRTSAAPAALLFCAALAAAYAPPARARDGAHEGDELAALINAYRAAPGLCAGSGAAPAAPLQPEAALSRVRIGFGTFLEPALKKAGYASDRAESISVTGPPDAQAAMTVLREKYCDKLLSAEYSAVGTARRGNEWQVVLAHPLVLPPLPDPAQLRGELLALVNEARATPRTCGAEAFGAAPPLTWNETLARAALGHSRDMAEKHYFNHKEPGGSDPPARATQAGYQWSRISENIASGQRTVAEAVAGWLASPGHCANIMNPTVTEMGAAYAVNPANAHRTLYWTQMFGRPR